MRRSFYLSRPSFGVQFRALKSIGAAYRIRTYDVLIRSQTLYPAEVTPQRTDYYARDPSMGQATIWKNFMKHRLSSFADPHRLRPPAGALARSLKTLRVFFTPAPCTEFDSPRYGLEIKRQVDISIYLPVTYGGGAENRTPVHESPLIGISKLSRWFSLGRFARSDTLAAS